MAVAAFHPTVIEELSSQGPMLNSVTKSGFDEKKKWHVSLFSASDSIRRWHIRSCPRISRIFSIGFSTPDASLLSYVEHENTITVLF